MGERTIEAEGSIFFEDVTNNLKACIIFSSYKKSGFWKKVETGLKDEFYGLIYECTPITNLHASAKLLFSKSSEDVKDLKSLKDIVKSVCEIKGSWLRHLIIGDKEYWNIEIDNPERQIPALEDVCPSDWRYREDLLWLKYNYMTIAQKWKIRMEEQQRLDRKNRLLAEKERQKAGKKKK